MSFEEDLALYGPDSGRAVISLKEARDYTGRLARDHYENFPVLSGFLPRGLQEHFGNVYAYCRWSDDLADEIPDSNRSLELLDWWEEELDGAYRNQARHPVMIALVETIQRFEIPQELFGDLLTAFRRDQRQVRYDSFEELLDYCRCSANPVGRIVLYLCESFSPDRAHLSDSICTGLQLANFWQDVAPDTGKGRIYLPLEDIARFEVLQDDILSKRFTPQFGSLLEFEVDRAGDFLQAGLPLAKEIPGRLGLVIALFAQGGLTILRKIRRVGYDVFADRPKLRKWDAPLLWARALGTTMSPRVLGGSRSPQSLEIAYTHCQRIARREARNFYYSFLVLPPEQRRSMCALYTFLRKTDDLGDCDAPIDERRKALAKWRGQLEGVLAGEPASEPWWIALTDTLERHCVPDSLLFEVIDGVSSDLDTTRYETFEDLYRYCYRVASVVGLACIRIWGVTDERASKPAEFCGVAFQLTNILRDLTEDFHRGRIYLPREDLRRFGVEEKDLGRPDATPEFLELMHFQIQRTQEYYDRAQPLEGYLPPSGQAVLQVMVDIYDGILRKIEKSPDQVLKRRISLSPPRKLTSVLRALSTRVRGKFSSRLASMIKKSGSVNGS